MIQQLSSLQNNHNSFPRVRCSHDAASPGCHCGKSTEIVRGIGKNDVFQVIAVTSGSSEGSTMGDPYLGTARADPALHAYAEMMSRRTRRQSFSENLYDCLYLLCVDLCAFEINRICCAACYSGLVSQCCLPCVEGVCGAGSKCALLLRAIRDACWLPCHVFWQQGVCGCWHGLTWAKVATAVECAGVKAISQRHSVRIFVHFRYTGQRYGYVNVLGCVYTSDLIRCRGRAQESAVAEQNQSLIVVFFVRMKADRNHESPTIIEFRFFPALHPLYVLGLRNRDAVHAHGGDYVCFRAHLRGDR